MATFFSNFLLVFLQMSDDIFSVVSVVDGLKLVVF